MLPNECVCVLGGGGVKWLNRSGKKEMFCLHYDTWIRQVVYRISNGLIKLFEIALNLTTLTLWAQNQIWGIQ